MDHSPQFSNRRYAYDLSICWLRQIIKINDLIGIHIHNCGFFELCDRHCIPPVNMDMPVQHQAGLHPLQQVAHNFEASMGNIGLIMNAKRWGMGHKNVQETAVSNLVL